LNHIEYTPKNLRDLREKLQNAILELEKEEKEEGYESKTSDEMIIELKSQLRKEEERASKFKKELHESEERESKLKDHIREVEAIKNNPVEEAKNQITKLEGTIAQLKSKLKFTEEDKKDTIVRLTETLKEKEEKLKILEKEFDSYKNSKDEEPLSTFLLDETKRRAEAKEWIDKAYNEVEKGNYEKAIQYYTKAIELNSDMRLLIPTEGLFTLTSRNMKRR
jgi:tetratricopeptide (TPR) repeat protein